MFSLARFCSPCVRHSANCIFDKPVGVHGLPRGIGVALHGLHREQAYVLASASPLAPRTLHLVPRTSYIIASVLHTLPWPLLFHLFFLFVTPLVRVPFSYTYPLGLRLPSNRLQPTTTQTPRHITTSVPCRSLDAVVATDCFRDNRLYQFRPCYSRKLPSLHRGTRRPKRQHQRRRCTQAGRVSRRQAQGGFHT
jgi:hypothetical protein